MKVYSIQYLRGIAAIMVVIFHLQIQLQRMHYDGPFPNWLSSGVDIFFVISGFIMWSTTVDRKMGASEFMMRRIVRIVPLYWSITTFFVAMMFVAPNAFQSSRFNLSHVVSSYLFFPYEHPVTHTMEPIVIPGWTLNYEMFFYLLFAVWLPVEKNVRFAGVLLTLVAITFLRLFTANEVVNFYAFPLILEFGFGVIVAQLVRKGIFLPRSFIFMGIPFFVGTVCAASYVNLREARFLLWGIPAAVLVFSVISFDRRNAFKPQRQLELVGDASYSIYLFHGVVLSAVSQFWQRMMPYDSGLSLSLFCFVGTAASVIAGICLYWFFERPVEAYGKSLLRRTISYDWTFLPIPTKTPKYNGIKPPGISE